MTGCGGGTSKECPGRGSSDLISAIISARSSASTRHSCISAAALRAASSGRWSSRRCIAGSSRLRSRSCSARHSARSRAKMPGGSNSWTRASTRSTCAVRAAELAGGRVGIDAQIARLVEVIEQMRGDHPVDRIAEIGADLLVQVLAQAARTAPPPGRWPVHRRRRAPDPSRPNHESPSLGAAFDRVPSPFSPDAACQCSAASPTISPTPSASCSGRASGALARLGAGLAGAGRRLVARWLAEFQKRVLLDLGLDEFAQFEVRQLQQLDRLLQLRRHDQRLALPKLQALRKTDPVHEKAPSGRCL